MRATSRFTDSRATLLAAGTTYYLFLALFSALTLAYGLTAALGADRLSAYITEALSEAFPGLVGGSGIDPNQLQSIGQTTSIIGAVGLLYGATGAVLGASRSIHVVYGAPSNTRNFVWVRLWASAGSSSSRRWGLSRAAAVADHGVVPTGSSTDRAAASSPCTPARVVLQRWEPARPRPRAGRLPGHRRPPARAHVVAAASRTAGPWTWTDARPHRAHRRRRGGARHRRPRGRVRQDRGRGRRTVARAAALGAEAPTSRTPGRAACSRWRSRRPHRCARRPRHRASSSC